MDKVVVNGEEYVKSSLANKKQMDKVLGCLGDVMYDSLKAHRAFIAGGAILSAFTNTDINDVDVYFRSYEDMKSAFLEVTQNWDNVYLSHTDKSITLVDKDTSKVVQFIYFDYFNTAQEIFDCFDFTVCMAAIDLEAETLILDDRFLVDVASRSIHFNNGTRYPYVSLIRTRKYRDKGYRIGKGNLLAIGLACSSMPITSWQNAKDQLGGVYGYEIDLQVENDAEFTQEKLHEILTDLAEKQVVISHKDYDELVRKFKEEPSDSDVFGGVE